MNNIKIQTPAEGFLDISIEIKKFVRESGVVKGLCNVYIPHTTAGITINENADPDVVTDMLEGLDKIVLEKGVTRNKFISEIVLKYLNTLN